MRFYIEYYTYLALILIAFVASILSSKRNRGDNVLSMLFLLTFFSELLATIFTQRYKNNLIIYHFFNPVQFLLITIYFNDVIVSFKQKNVGVIIGLFGVMLSIINSILIQKTNQFNSFFLLFEGIVIIALSLHFFYTTILQDKQLLFKNKHLWIGLIFLFFWSATYTYWALSEATTRYAKDYLHTIAEILLIVNIITYAALSLIFILNKKKVLHNGN